MARAGLQGASAEMVLLVTAGVPSQDTMPMIRSVLGPVGVAGGATAAILTHNGAVGSGALVVCLANGDGAVSGVAASSGRDLADAAQGAARLILAGWPFRMRYPRGLGLAFCRPGVGAPAESFLASWRLLMGPKMRTVCSVLSTPAVYGASQGEPIVSAACLEAPYSTGLGYAEGFEAGSMAHPPAPLPKPPPRIRLRRQKPSLEPRSLRPAWLGAGDVALQEVPRGQFGVACGRRPVAAAPRQVHLHEGSRRDQLLCLRVRWRHAVDAHHAVCAAATAQEARRRVHRPIAENRARVGLARPRADRDRLAEAAAILARAARVGSQALSLDDQRSEALDDLDGRSRSARGR